MNPEDELAMQAQQQQIAGGAPGQMAPQTGARPAMPEGAPNPNRMQPPMARPRPAGPPVAGRPGGGMAGAGFGAPRPPMGGGPGAFGMKPAAPQAPAGPGMPLPTKAPIQRGALPMGAGRR